MSKADIYEGNLTIHNAAGAEKYRHLIKVTGYLSISASAKLDALKSVGGSLYISASANLDALESVGGSLHIYASANLDAPKLESVGGYLHISASANLDALKSVGDYLSISASAKLDALKSVGGYLYISASANLDALESVGGSLHICASANLDAPKLKSVGDYLYISSSARLDAPKLESVGGSLHIYEKGSLTAGKLYPDGFDKFMTFDNIGCIVLSEKLQNDVTIRLCRHSKINNRKVVGDKFFVASGNGHNAHGKTIAEATQELAFKAGSRDVSQWENMPRDTVKTPAEWAFVYRMITGACRYGTDQFIASKRKMKNRYTLTEIVAETKGAFGHDRFCAVVGLGG